MQPLEFEGGSLFRFHIICSILSGIPVRISRINGGSGVPGLSDFEVNFLKFIARVSAGSAMEVSGDNCAVLFVPGVVVGGALTHTLPPSRGAGYFVEACLLLGPFGRKPLEATLLGPTQHRLDPAASTLRAVALRWARRFGIDADVRIVAHSAGPRGCVVVTVAPQRQLNAVNIAQRGKIKRVRGIAFASNTAPDLPNKAATAAKGVLLNILPDVYIVTDISNKEQAQSSGYGIMLVAESTASGSHILSQETIAEPMENPVNVGKRVAHLLLEQVMAGGCIDAHHQALTLILAAMAKNELSILRFGALSPLGVSVLGLLKDFFSISCAIKEEPSVHDGMPPSILISLVGTHRINVSKRSG